MSHGRRCRKSKALSRRQTAPQQAEREGSRMRLRGLIAVTMVVGLLAVTAACGDDDDSSTGTTTAGGGGGKCTVGVSWNNYQEERWAKFDEPAIKDAVEAGGGSYVSNDAKSSAETQ